MALDTMRDLLVAQLRELYSAETQVTRALPRLADGAANGILAEAFRTHLKETAEQIARLERIFELLGESPRGRKAKGMSGLLAEAADTLDEPGFDFVRDAGLIAIAQRIEHYEISAYRTARALAHLVGEDDVAVLVDESLQQEVAADDRLGEIAETEVNPKGMLSAEAETSRS